MNEIQEQRKKLMIIIHRATIHREHPKCLKYFEEVFQRELNVLQALEFDKSN